MKARKSTVDGRDAMLTAAQQAVPERWSTVRRGISKVLEQESPYLTGLVAARRDGELDDDAFAVQLRDEALTLATLLRPIAGLSADSAKAAAAAVVATCNADLERSLQTPATAGAGTGDPKVRASAPRVTLDQRRLNARPDTVDFRDLMYVPTLIEVGTELPLERYLEASAPILDQGREGACTGYGLATVVHYLLRTRRNVPDHTAVSPRMLYEMARKYDEWQGESYEGSSCRGAMKGWYKHGVCADKFWQHDARKPQNNLDRKRAVDARQRPLGAYFRVNHKDLVAMHAALTEVGILYASGSVHAGWDAVKKDGIVHYEPGAAVLGGHAFAIVAYDRTGFWIQNSWGDTWGKRGLCHVSYDDWLNNGSDAWVARLGVPLALIAELDAVGNAFSVSGRARTIAYDIVRPHVISIGNNGEFKTSGAIGTTPAMARQIIHDDFARVTADWKKKRLLLYAHGGLVDEDAAIQRVADYREALLQAECYPLAFIWHSDFWTTLRNVLTDALQKRQPEGAIGDAKDFLLDRVDDLLEPVARGAGGKLEWDQMKQNAIAATEAAAGAARMVLDEIAAFSGAQENGSLQIHLVAHSAGAIFHAPVVRRLASPAPNGLGLPIASCTLWAPACTMSMFEEYYAPLLQNGIEQFNLYTLTDKAERDDNCARLYNKSLLYLVADAFETRPRIPLLRPDGEPLLGMDKFAASNDVLKRALRDPRNSWLRAPSNLPVGDPAATHATAHGAFDDDPATVKGTLARIVGMSARSAAAQRLQFRSGRAHLRDKRRRLDALRT